MDTPEAKRKIEIAVDSTCVSLAFAATELHEFHWGVLKDNLGAILENHRPEHDPDG